MRTKGTAEELERRRGKAIELVVAKGIAQREVARRLDVNERTVRTWVKLYRQRGKAGLKVRRATGRPRRLGERERKSLVAKLLKGAKANGFASDLWTCPRVAELIERLFGVKYHVDHVVKILHSLGWTPQRPQRRAIEQDKEALRQWREKDWPRIKKKPAV